MNGPMGVLENVQIMLKEQILVCGEAMPNLKMQTTIIGGGDSCSSSYGKLFRDQIHSQFSTGAELLLKV